MARKTVKAPAGFHWMKKGNNTYKLMKNPAGGFKKHPGGSLSASLIYKKYINLKRKNNAKRRLLS